MMTEEKNIYDLRNMASVEEDLHANLNHTQSWEIRGHGGRSRLAYYDLTLLGHRDYQVQKVVIN